MCQSNSVFGEGASPTSSSIDRILRVLRRGGESREQDSSKGVIAGRGATFFGDMTKKAAAWELTLSRRLTASSRNAGLASVGGRSSYAQAQRSGEGDAVQARR